MSFNRCLMLAICASLSTLLERLVTRWAGVVAACAFGGSGFAGVSSYDTFEHTVHGLPYALRIRLPPLAGVFLKRVG